MNDYCNNWACSHNKDGLCVANAEESAQCLNELLAAFSTLKKVLEKEK